MLRKYQAVIGKALHTNRLRKHGNGRYGEPYKRVRGPHDITRQRSEAILIQWCAGSSYPASDNTKHRWHGLDVP